MKTAFTSTIRMGGSVSSRRCMLTAALAFAFVQPTFAMPAPGVTAYGSRPIGRDAATASHGSEDRARDAFGHLPLRFEQNLGQSSPEVQFTARGRGYTLALTPTEAVFTLAGDRRPPAGAPTLAPTSVERVADAPRSTSILRIRLEDGDPNAAFVGQGLLPGVSHYYIGSDPSRWRTNVPGFAAVRQIGAYPGIDLVYYEVTRADGGGGDLEYDFVLSPGADPSLIRLRFDGADSLRVDENGDLLLDTPAGQMRHLAPVLYQDAGDGRREVAGQYDVRGDEVGFSVGAYDTTIPLVIDPVLAYSTYLGGGLEDNALGVAVDASGSAYVTGYTSSTDFPAPGETTPPAGNYESFVTKLNTAGTGLVYSLYIGGEADDLAQQICLDGDGGVYIAGGTASAEFPTTPSAYQRRLDGSSAAFVAKFDAADGHLVWSTYFGGTGGNVAAAVAADGSGDVYIAGATNSVDLPIFRGYQGTYGGGSQDAFVAKLSPSLSGGSSLRYSTYLGGTGADFIAGLAVDESGAAYAAGSTASNNFPTRAAYQGTYGGLNDAFVAKLDPSVAGNSSLLYSTYLGGSDFDACDAIAADSAHAIYVVGNTASMNFPTKNPFHGDLAGSRDAFVTKLSPAGDALGYSTYFGGVDFDGAFGVALDPAGALYITGITSSTDFPVLNGFQDDFLGGADAFVAKLAPSAGGSASVLYSSNFGGGLGEAGFGIALDTAGNAYVAGTTESTLFPVFGPPYQGNQGGADGFVTKIGDAVANLTLTCDGAPDPVASGGQVTYTMTVSNAGPSVADAVVLTNPTPAGTTFVSASASQGSVASPSPGSTGTLTCSLGALDIGASAIVTLTLDVTAAPGATVANTATVTSLIADTNPSDNAATATTTVGAEIVAPAIASVTGLQTPFRIRIRGTNLQPGIQVFVGGDTTPWSNVRYKGSALVLKGGAALQARFPKGAPVTIRVVNPDGGEDSATFTR